MARVRAQQHNQCWKVVDALQPLAPLCPPPTPHGTALGGALKDAGQTMRVKTQRSTLFNADLERGTRSLQPSQECGYFCSCMQEKLYVEMWHARVAAVVWYGRSIQPQNSLVIDAHLAGCAWHAHVCCHRRCYRASTTTTCAVSCLSIALDAPH